MLNKIILIGRLTRSPECRRGGDDVSFYTFTLAFNQDKKNDSCEFVDCTCGTHLNKAVEHLNQGDKIAISGEFSNRKFTRKDGSTGISAVIYVEDIEFIDVSKKGENPVKEEIKEEPKSASTRRTNKK